MPSPNSESAYLDLFPIDKTFPGASEAIKLCVNLNLPIGLTIFPFSIKKEPFRFNPVTTWVIGSKTLPDQNSLM